MHVHERVRFSEFRSIITTNGSRTILFQNFMKPRDDWETTISRSRNQISWYAREWYLLSTKLISPWSFPSPVFLLPGVRELEKTKERTVILGNKLFKNVVLPFGIAQAPNPWWWVVTRNHTNIQGLRSQWSQRERVFHFGKSCLGSFWSSSEKQ